MKLFMMNVILNRENKLSDVSYGVLFYCLIKFNQKILILSRFATKYDCSYVIMTTELFIKYFCNLKLCCLWRFNDKISVIYTRRHMRRLIAYFLCLKWHSTWRVSYVLLTSLSANNYVVRAKEIIIFVKILDKLKICWLSLIRQLKRDRHTRCQIYFLYSL
jgi:hypothetical protein